QSEYSLFLEVSQYISAGLYKEEDVLRTQISLLERTNMVVFRKALCEQLTGTKEASPELEEWASSVKKRMSDIETAAQPVVNILLDETNVQRLRGDRSLNSSLMQVRLFLSQDIIELLESYTCRLACGLRTFSSVQRPRAVLPP
ncbi:MAG: hypothetical protein HC846_04930, partial [Blastocatellia bacterium]|nr:hypothetical protein [Blastocatellia bacterium]